MRGGIEIPPLDFPGLLEAIRGISQGFPSIGAYFTPSPWLATLTPWLATLADPRVAPDHGAHGSHSSSWG